MCVSFLVSSLSKNLCVMMISVYLANYSAHLKTFFLVDWESEIVYVRYLILSNMYLVL